MVISDIHLGDSRSFQAPHPHGWFSANIPVLAQFLDEQLNASDVKELVILGDLFEQWVIPTNYIPLNALDKICSHKANKPVIERLKALAAKPEIKLTYAPGNHDIEAVFKAIIEDAGLSLKDKIKMTGIPGYPDSMTIEEAGQRFRDLFPEMGTNAGPEKVNIGTENTFSWDVNIGVIMA